MRLLAIALIWSSFATGIWANSSPVAEPTSWTLTCEAETAVTTETPGRIAIVKVTAENACEGPVLHWKSPTASWVTLALRPVTDRTWASRLDLGTEDGTHQLQCMFVGGTGGKDEIMSRTYHFTTPDMTLIQTGVPEIWNHASEREPESAPPIATMPVQVIPPPVPAESKAGSSWVLAVMLISLLNLLFAFSAGLAFAIHRRRKAHCDDAALLEIKQRFQAAGLIGPQIDISVSGPESEPEHIDVAEVIAEETVLESMNQTIAKAADETPTEEPDEGVDIRKTHAEEPETKLDINDLSF